jgi:hypothetical protein
MNAFAIVSLVFAGIGLGFSIMDDEPKYAGICFAVLVFTVLAAVNK